MIFKLLRKFLFCVTAIACIVTYFPKLLLNETVRDTLPKSLDAFTALESLNVSTFEQFGPVHGPESIAQHNGRLVTGSVDGHLYELVVPDGTVKPLMKVPRFKSRPLGLKFDSKGVLFVVDINTGVYKVEDVFGLKPTVNLVFDIQQTAAIEPGGQKPSRFLNDVAIVEKRSKNENGHILFISDVSANYSPGDSMHTILRLDPGRLIRYDTESRQVSELKDGGGGGGDGGHHFVTPNGVESSADGESVLFVELLLRTVWRYRLKDGSLKRIISGLPGEPDNIRRSAKGDTFWIAIINPRSQSSSAVSSLDFFMARPLFRHFTVSVISFFGGVLEKLGQLLPGSVGSLLEELGSSFKSLMILFSTIFPSEGGMMLEIDIDGNIVSSIYSHSENFSMISEVREMPASTPNQRLFYLASVEKPYIRKLVIEN